MPRTFASLALLCLAACPTLPDAPSIPIPSCVADRAAGELEQHVRDLAPVLSVLSIGGEPWLEVEPKDAAFDDLQIGVDGDPMVDAPDGRMPLPNDVGPWTVRTKYRVGIGSKEFTTTVELSAEDRKALHGFTRRPATPKPKLEPRPEPEPDPEPEPEPEPEVAPPPPPREPKTSCLVEADADDTIDVVGFSADTGELVLWSGLDGVELRRIAVGDVVAIACAGDRHVVVQHEDLHMTVIDPRTGASAETKPASALLRAAWVGDGCLELLFGDDASTFAQTERGAVGLDGTPRLRCELPPFAPFERHVDNRGLGTRVGELCLHSVRGDAFAPTGIIAAVRPKGKGHRGCRHEAAMMAGSIDRAALADLDVVWSFEVAETPDGYPPNATVTTEDRDILVMRLRLDGGAWQLRGLDRATGVTRYRRRVAEKSFLRLDGQRLFVQGRHLSVLDPETGDEIWSQR